MLVSMANPSSGENPAPLPLHCVSPAPRPGSRGVGHLLSCMRECVANVMSAFVPSVSGAGAWRARTCARERERGGGGRGGGRQRPRSLKGPELAALVQSSCWAGLGQSPCVEHIQNTGTRLVQGRTHHVPQTGKLTEMLHEIESGKIVQACITHMSATFQHHASPCDTTP